MVKENEDYSEYSVTKTYSLKIRNVKKIDEINEKQKFNNKSKALNHIIEEYEDKDGE